jgi:signal transduction histidine kinase
VSASEQPPQGLVTSLQRSLAWLDMAMDGLADGLVIAHEDGRLRWANRSFSRSCGVESCVTLVDRPLGDLLGDWRPADAAADWSLLPLPPGPEGEDGVVRLQRQHEGDRHWLELHWRRLNFRDSVQLILTLRDITLAVRAERTRLQEEEQLRHLLEQERAFAQAMAHELRTPLAIASLELQCLARELQGQALQGPEARLAAIHHELDRMARLLERVSWLNSLQLQPPPSSAAPTALAIAPLLRRCFRTIDHLPDAALLVQGSADELTQLLQELQQNALRFGGGRTPAVRHG